jgi:hypothetical protein
MDVSGGQWREDWRKGCPPIAIELIIKLMIFRFCPHEPRPALKKRAAPDAGDGNSVEVSRHLGRRNIDLHTALGSHVDDLANARQFAKA